MHAGVEAEAEGLEGDRISHRSLETSVPAGQNLGRCRDAAAWAQATPPTARTSLPYGQIAQPLDIEALVPVKGLYHLDRVVGLHPSCLASEAMEALLDILARDGVKRAIELRDEVTVDDAAVGGEVARLALGADGEIPIRRWAAGRAPGRGAMHP